MRFGRTALKLAAQGVAVFALATASLGGVACGGPGEGKVAKVQAGDMPAGAEWTGVYYSQLYGHLHMVQEGNTVSGKWIRPVKDRWGELHGNVTGDVVHFEWSEHVIGSVGPSSTRKGKGYFKYKRPPGDNVDDLVVGEIGIGNDEVGEPWDAVKQRNMMPDLGSIGGSSTQDIGGGDWDKDNSEPGTPESPAPPPPP